MLPIHESISSLACEVAHIQQHITYRIAQSMPGGPSHKHLALQPPRKPDDLIIHHGEIIARGEDNPRREQEHQKLRDVPVAQDRLLPDIEIDAFDAQPKGHVHQVDAERDLAQVLREAPQQRALQGRVELERVDGREATPAVPERMHVVAAPPPSCEIFQVRPRVVHEEERVVAPGLAEQVEADEEEDRVEDFGFERLGGCWW